MKVASITAITTEWIVHMSAADQSSSLQAGPEQARKKPANLVWDDPFLLEN